MSDIEKLNSVKFNIRKALESQGSDITADTPFEEYPSYIMEISGVEPTGTIIITENGTVDVSEYAQANVDVPASAVVSGTKNITANGTNIDVTDYAAVDVNVSGSAEWPNKIIIYNNSSISVDLGISYAEGRFRWLGLQANANAERNVTVYVPPGQRASNGYLTMLIALRMTGSSGPNDIMAYQYNNNIKESVVQGVGNNMRLVFINQKISDINNFYIAIEDAADV